MQLRTIRRHDHVFQSTITRKLRNHAKITRTHRVYESRRQRKSDGQRKDQSQMSLLFVRVCSSPQNVFERLTLLSSDPTSFDQRTAECAGLYRTLTQVHRLCSSAICYQNEAFS